MDVREEKGLMGLRVCKGINGYYGNYELMRDWPVYEEK
jgi:hypothetical protein